ADGFLTFKALFGALLTTSNPAATALRTALDERGAPSGQVAETYEEYLAGPEGYSDFLADRFPWPPARELPAYATDRPPQRTAPVDPIDPGDLVQISAEVDAFAFLIASKTLPPPLAVGLFGDWGSGKSYFLRSLQRRIDRLIADGAALPDDQPLPFHRSISQIEFNAWQYVQGDLWASLLDHIIRNLAPTTDEDDPVDQARQAYLTEIRATTDQSAALRRQKLELEDERSKAATEVERREAQRERALEELQRQRRERPIRALVATPELQRRVKEVADKAGVGAIVAQSEDAARVLAESRAAARQAGGIVTAIRQGGVYFAALLALLALTPAVVWLVAQVDTSAVTQVATAIASLLATALGVLKTGTDAMTKVLREADAAEAELLKVENQAIEQAQERLSKADEQLSQAEKTQFALTTRLEDLESKLAQVTPALVLDDFLKDRLGSDDYRRLLGLPAIVRRDLERLSNIIDDENTQTGPRSKGGTRINRVVLYIDDLDRCPTDVVLQVLQAVHLLLAFPLFVVVVAVDSRWLSSSLKAHYEAQLGGDVTPDDYLEKIFQVAFWVQPMDDDARRRMVRGLLARNVASGGSTDGSAGASEEAPELEQDLDALVHAMYDTTSQPPAWLEAATLAVTPEEMTFIEGLAPLLGTTPRSVKRFVNVFQLVKTIARAHGPVTQESVERLLFLLAVSTGPPETARQLFTAIEQSPPPRTLATVVKGLTSPAAIETWLKGQPAWRRLHVAELRPWLEPVRRFWFRAAQATPATAPAPPAAKSAGARAGP
ncbi:MAG TPA: P-loop NTPase fold protein, partial [Acidimicrobiales bacterium]|nr:P-loop NTPase fold protein [Acidimicrobiales bacterium]